MPVPLTSSTSSAHLLQQLWNKRRELAPFFVIGRNLMMGTPGKGDKYAMLNK